MRKVLLASMLLACVSASAQDVLITQNGDVMNVYDVEVGPNSVFYKNENNTSAPMQRIDKKEVFVIKRKDGTKYNLGNNTSNKEASSVANTSSLNAASGASAVAASVSEGSRKRNEDIINRINNINPEYKANDTKDRCGRLFCLLGVKPGSLMVNDELEMSVQIGNILPEGKNGYKNRW